MFEKCGACGKRLITAGARVGDRKFCNAGCAQAFQAKTAADLVPEDVLEAAVREVFEGKCPACGGSGPNEVYRATKVTGMVVMFQVQTVQKVCCAACGRKQRLKAAGHCAVAGWWGPRAALINLFVLPANLIAAARIRPATEPSANLREVVRAAVGARLVNQARGRG